MTGRQAGAAAVTVADAPESAALLGPAEPVGAASGRRGRRAIALGVGWTLVPLIVLGVWSVVATQSDLVPAIGPTVSELVRGFTDGWIVAPLKDTLTAAFVGFAIGAAAAFPVGFALGAVPVLGRAIDPLLAAGFGVPRIILYPVFLALFGLGLESKIWMAAVSAFFPAAITTTAGIRAVAPTLVTLGRSVSCTRRQLVTKIYLPAASPTLMSGCRISLSISFVAVILAELFAASQGLGRLLSQAYSLQLLPRMFAVVLLITLMALVANLALWLLERRLHAVIE